MSLLELMAWGIGINLVWVFFAIIILDIPL